MPSKQIQYYNDEITRLFKFRPLSLKIREVPSEVARLWTRVSDPRGAGFGAHVPLETGIECLFCFRMTVSYAWLGAESRNPKLVEKSPPCSFGELTEPVCLALRHH